MRVAHLILPSLAAVTLAAGAPSASASTGGGAGLRTGSAKASGMPTPGATSPGETAPVALTPGLTLASSGTCTPTTASSASPSASATSGGVGVGVGVGLGMGEIGVNPGLPCPHPLVTGATAEIVDGIAYAPADAPLQVQKAIWAGDRIRLKPYQMGGGHGKWNDSAYDCSGSVSYVLHAAGLLKVSEDSGQMMSWGRRGAGAWITVYSNPGHAFVEIAGVRLDTSAEQDPKPAPGSGPRWRPLMTSTTGFVARHPLGL